MLLRILLSISIAFSPIMAFASSPETKVSNIIQAAMLFEEGGYEDKPETAYVLLKYAEKLASETLVYDEDRIGVAQTVAPPLTSPNTTLPQQQPAFLSPQIRNQIAQQNAAVRALTPEKPENLADPVIQEIRDAIFILEKDHADVLDPIKADLADETKAQALFDKALFEASQITNGWSLIEDPGSSLDLTQVAENVPDYSSALFQLGQSITYRDISRSGLQRGRNIDPSSIAPYRGFAGFSRFGGGIGNQFGFDMGPLNWLIISSNLLSRDYEMEAVLLMRRYKGIGLDALADRIIRNNASAQVAVGLITDMVSPFLASFQQRNQFGRPGGFNQSFDPSGGFLSGTMNGITSGNVLTGTPRGAGATLLPDVVIPFLLYAHTYLTLAALYDYEITSFADWTVGMGIALVMGHTMFFLKHRFPKSDDATKKSLFGKFGKLFSGMGRTSKLEKRIAAQEQMITDMQKTGSEASRAEIRRLEESNRALRDQVNRLNGELRATARVLSAHEVVRASSADMAKRMGLDPDTGVIDPDSPAAKMGIDQNTFDPDRQFGTGDSFVTDDGPEFPRQPGERPGTFNPPDKDGFTQRPGGDTLGPIGDQDNPFPRPGPGGPNDPAKDPVKGDPDKKPPRMTWGQIFGFAVASLIHGGIRYGLGYGFGEATQHIMKSAYIEKRVLHNIKFQKFLRTPQGMKFFKLLALTVADTLNSRPRPLNIEDSAVEEGDTRADEELKKKLRFVKNLARSAGYCQETPEQALALESQIMELDQEVERLRVEARQTAGCNFPSALPDGQAQTAAAGERADLSQLEVKYTCAMQEYNDEEKAQRALDLHNKSLDMKFTYQLCGIEKREQSNEGWLEIKREFQSFNAITFNSRHVATMQDLEFENVLRMGELILQLQILDGHRSDRDIAFFDNLILPILGLSNTVALQYFGEYQNFILENGGMVEYVSSPRGFQVRMLNEEPIISYDWESGYSEVTRPSTKPTQWILEPPRPYQPPGQYGFGFNSGFQSGFPIQ